MDTASHTPDRLKMITNASLSTHQHQLTVKDLAVSMIFSTLLPEESLRRTKNYIFSATATFGRL